MKLHTLEALKTIVSELKQLHKTVVFTNGCFDILHAGHVRYLAEAKKLGDYLIVGLNSDDSVRALKGPTRPINGERDRAEVLGALAAVDAVVLFHQQTAEEPISQIRPDIYVKGGDYQVEQLPEAPVVERYGGRIVIIPEVPGRSSSRIIKQITGQQNHEC